MFWSKNHFNFFSFYLRIQVWFSPFSGEILLCYFSLDKYFFLAGREKRGQSSFSGMTTPTHPIFMPYDKFSEDLFHKWLLRDSLLFSRQQQQQVEIQQKERKKSSLQKRFWFRSNLKNIFGAWREKTLAVYLYWFIDRMRPWLKDSPCWQFFKLLLLLQVGKMASNELESLSPVRRLSACAFA